MTIHVALECESAYRYARTTLKGQSITYCTTSPWLLEKLPEAGEKVISLEEGVRPEDAHEIGELALIITEGIAAHIDERMTGLPSGMKPGTALAECLFRTLAALYYKAWLLDRFVEKAKRSHEETFVIGDPVFQFPEQFIVLLPRRAMLFAALAEASGEEALQVIRFKAPDWEAAAEKKIRSVGRGPWERTINIINMDYSTLLFKVHRNWCNWENADAGNGNADVLILKQNPLIEEAVFPMRRKGLRVRILPPLERTDTAGDESGVLGPFDRFHEQFRTLIKRASKIGRHGRLVDGATRMAASFTMHALNFARAQGNHVEEYVDRQIVRNRRNERSVVLTNGLSLPWEVMLYQCCKHRGVPVFFVSHGVSAGLSKYHDRARGVMSFSHGDSSFGYSEGESHPDMVHKVTGAPVSERRIAGRGIQRALARRRLHVPHGKRMIMYVSNLYSNNSVDLPYGGTNDFFQHNLKRTMIHEVFKELPDHCIVKLYPTQRYADPDPFLATKPFPHVDITQWSEFRYLRAACDVVICDMAQSAFGWAWSTEVPLVLLTTPYYPLLPDVLKELENAVFLVSTEDDAWGKNVLSLLRLPDNELRKMWREKEPVRRRTSQERILGPQNGVGKVITQVILEATHGNAGGTIR